MNAKKAREFAEEALIEHQEHCGVPLGLQARPPIETSRAWLFFYQSREYIQTGQRESMLIGAGPVYVDKSTKNVYFLGTWGSLEQVVENLERRLHGAGQE